MAEFVRVTSTADVKSHHCTVAEVNGKTLAVFNLEGTFHAIDNTCIHRGGPLGKGDVKGSVVTCPWHGWQFNVTTGGYVNNPSVKVEVYQVKVENNEVKVLV